MASTDANARASSYRSALASHIAVHSVVRRLVHCVSVL